MHYRLWILLCIRIPTFILKATLLCQHIISRLIWLDWNTREGSAKILFSTYGSVLMNFVSRVLNKIGR